MNQPLPPPQKTSYYTGVALVFFGAVAFAGKAVLVRYNYIHYHVDTISLLALRMLFSAPFYLCILLANNKQDQHTHKLSKKEWFAMLVIGLVGYYLAALFDFWGLSYVTASVERLILFVYPTIVVVISAIFFRKPIVLIQYIALLITYLGVVFAFIPDLQLGMQKDLVIGSILVFLSAFTYALYLIGSGEMIPKVGSLRFTCYAMLISTMMVLIHYYLSKPIGLFSYSTEVYVLSFIMALFTTVIPSFMISDGIKKIGSSNASIIGSIGPVATIIMANIFLDEPITFWQIGGTIIVLIGVLMISIKGKS
ncbi:DMT family transporter [Flectobacillus major]|uniref:DMT family transporter n=1 Tax=Flectobacillus major TaxID=103 RepID=UPI00041BEB3C|nr:DMT family transporter [Flectobacillus major]